MIEGAIEIRAFGPLRITRDGDDRRCGGGAERAVLATLLLWPAQSIGLDQLGRTAWGPGDLPHDPPHALQTHVMRLRHHLGADFIETDHHGYRAAVDPEAVDTHRFSGRAAAAERALEAGRLEESAACSTRRCPMRAVATPGWTWSDDPPVTAARARLHEMRLRAEERRVALFLRLGKPTAGEPERLTAEEPLREERWELLMRAQAMAGRQAGALRSYTQARHHLRTELGLSPGSGLRDLERRVLQQDPTLLQPESLSEILG